MVGGPAMSGDGVPEVGVRYSVDELAAIAELAGFETFPGTGEHRLDDPDCRLAVRRALVARGTVRAADDGTLSVEPVERAVLGRALRPDLVLRVTHVSATARLARLVYVARGLSVTHADEGGGIHRLAAFATRLLPRRLAALTGLRPRAAVAAPALTLPGHALEGLRDGRLDLDVVAGAAGVVRSSARVTVIRRIGGRVQGGEVLWLDRDPLGLWLLSPGRDGGDLVPAAADEIVDRVRLLAG